MEAAVAQRQVSITTPLLSTRSDPETPPVSKVHAGSSNEENDVTHDNLTTTVPAEARLLFKNALPLTLTYFLQYLPNLTTTLFIGHWGTAELGAFSLATMTANITGLAV